MTEYDHASAPITFAIITCSDTRGMKQDTAGAALEQLIADNGWVCKSHVVVKDEVPQISAAIVEACDTIDADMTGIVKEVGDEHVKMDFNHPMAGKTLNFDVEVVSVRDVTPEATQAVCDRNVPGIAEAMRAHSLAITPFAMLSRALCMQRGTHLVVNLPGSEKAARENWDGIVAALPHAVKMMAGGGH